jgi:DNA-binding FrmR family transcriptional regulator
MAQKTHQQLINNIAGQLNGIQAMIDRGDDCFEVLTQMKAARSGISSLMNKYLEENFINCLDNTCGGEGKDTKELKRLFEALIK